MHIRGRVPLIIFIIVVGAVVGGLVGQLIGMVLPAGIVKTFITKSISIGFAPIYINLYIMTFTFGFMLKFNIFSILGIVSLGYLLRWVY